MRLHCLHHTTFEGTANVERWASRRGYAVTHTLLPQQSALPEHEEYDLLVVFGGPMGAYEDRKHPWLVEEKKFLEQALIRHKGVFGICLGGQLLADVAGGRAYKGHAQEVGWFPVNLTSDGRSSELIGGFPEVFYPLHWHGDTFDLPAGAVLLASSECYPNQAFQIGDRALGIQFHLDLTFEDLEQIVRYQRFSKQDRFFQSRAEVVAQRERFSSCLFLLYQVLDAFELTIGEGRAAMPDDLSADEGTERRRNSGRR